jgi:hypothetical protein
MIHDRITKSAQKYKPLDKVTLVHQESGRDKINGTRT